MSGPFTAYVTASRIASDLLDKEGRDRAIDLLHQARCGRVVIESYRAGQVVEASSLESLQAYFSEHGFETLGGIMPTFGPGVGAASVGIETRQDYFCYSSETTVAFLEGELRKAAKHFNAIILGDAFATSCRCKACEAERDGGDRGAVRRALMCAVADRLVAAVHDANSAAKLIVKCPPHYDRSHYFGFDAERFPAIFDAVCVGTETRNPATPDYGYVEQYQGYFNARWMGGLAGEKFDGANFDYLDCNDQLVYDQGITTCLAAPSNVTLTSYDPSVFAATRIRRLAEAVPALEKLRSIARDPEGVHVIKPPNSDGGRDLFIYDYLGMMGIPSMPAPAVEPTMKSVIVPAQAMDDPSTPNAIRSALDAGGQVIVTWGALQRMTAHPDLLEFFGYAPSGVASGRALATEIEIDSVTRRTQGPCYIAGDLAPQDAAVLAWANVERSGGGILQIPFVTSRHLLSGGRAVVWNVDTFGHDAFTIQEPFSVPVKSHWFALPRRVIHYLRAMATAPLGYTIYLPARVAAFVLGDHLLFMNYTLNRVEAKVDGLPWDPASLESDSSGTVLSTDIIMIAPRSYALVKRIHST
jgi:hypothetical protein